jgi:hypothetical protein
VPILEGIIDGLLVLPAGIVDHDSGPVRDEDQRSANAGSRKENCQAE